MLLKKCQKMPNAYNCETCNFTCSKKSNYDKHLLTRKHQMLLNASKMLVEKIPHEFTCDCGKTYKHAPSYYRHKKECKKMPKMPDQTSGVEVHDLSSIQTSPELVTMLMKQLQDCHTHIVEISKNGGTNHSHNTTTHTNSHNKTFNLQFFLNETCQDAMNITDFVNSLKLTLQDLESVGELGYAEGISRMFVKGLKDLDVTKRPIHCSDFKREVIHIKDQDKWEKDENKEILTKAIKDVSTKNLMLMSDWQKENPGCTEYNHIKNDMYLKLMSTSIGPLDEQGEKKEIGKIMRTVAKTTIIDRENT